MLNYDTQIYMYMYHETWNDRKVISKSMSLSNYDQRFAWFFNYCFTISGLGETLALEQTSSGRLSVTCIFFIGPSPNGILARYRQTLHWPWPISSFQSILILIDPSALVHVCGTRQTIPSISMIYLLWYDSQLGYHVGPIQTRICLLIRFYIG